MPFIAVDENMDSVEIPARTAAPAVATVNLSGPPPLIIINACVSLSHCLASADSPENNCRTWRNGDPSTRRKQTPWKPLRSHAIRDHCCNYRARFSPVKTCTSSASATYRRRTATRRSTLGFTGCGSGQASSRCRLYSTLNSCCGNALSYVCARPRARGGAIAAVMAASLAPAFASFSLSLPPAAAAGRVAAGGVSFSSSSFGQVSGLVCVERKVAVLPPLAFSVRSNGGFIPAEHRWMHKGIENKGDVRRILFFSRLCVLICMFLHPRRIASSCRGTSSPDSPFLSWSFSEFFFFPISVSFSVVCVSLSLLFCDSFPRAKLLNAGSWMS